MDPTTSKLIARMKERRRALGLTQDDLARRCRMPTTVIASIECGRRRVRIDEAIALAEALEVGLDELIDTEAAAREGSA